MVSLDAAIDSSPARLWASGKRLMNVTVYLHATAAGSDVPLVLWVNG